MNVIFKMFAALVVSGLGAVARESPIVSVTSGKIQGSALGKGGAVFKGIPFATPPVGDLRWREPTPVKTWNGVRDASKFGVRCMQNGDGVREDCPHLNVWPLEWPLKSRKPVMLWILHIRYQTSRYNAKVLVDLPKPRDHAWIRNGRKDLNRIGQKHVRGTKTGPR